MRVCEEMMRFTINGNGDVTTCCWMKEDVIIGNMFTQEVDEMLNGEKYKKLIESAIEGGGDFRYCRECGKCKYILNGTLSEHMIEIKDYYPIKLNLAFELGCNYVCKCCRDSICKDNYTQEQLQIMERKVTELMKHMETISANGRGELFVSKFTINMLKKLKNKNEFPKLKNIYLETNGSLFNETNWKKLEHLGQYNLSVFITIHSFDEDTYQFLSGTNIKIQQILDNLKFVKSLREKGIINYLELATVVQERNFRQLPEFTKQCIEEFGADKVRLRSYFPFGAYDFGTEWFFNINNSYHPYYEEYLKIMKNPIFNHPKVYKWSGDLEIESGKNPFIRENIRFSILKDLILIDDVKQKIERYICDRNWNSISIYSMGAVGKAFLKIINDDKINIKYLIDKLGDQLGCDVLHISQIALNDLEHIIVTAPEYYEYIERDIRGYGYDKDIINILDLIEEIKKYD